MDHKKLAGKVDCKQFTALQACGSICFLESGYIKERPVPVGIQMVEKAHKIGKWWERMPSKK